MHHTGFRALVPSAWLLALTAHAGAITLGTEPAPSDTRFDAVCSFSRGLPNYLPVNNSFASGTLIAPGVVVLARHAVDQPDAAGRTVCSPDFDARSVHGGYAVRFRRRPDGSIGSAALGASSFFDAGVTRIVSVPGCPDIAVAFLDNPVAHITPMAVSFDSRMKRESRITLAGWGYDGQLRGTGERGRLLTGDEGLIVSHHDIITWDGSQNANLYDSGGAVLVQGNCTEPALIGVITGPSSGTPLRVLPQSLRLLASRVRTCDATGSDSYYPLPPPVQPGPGIEQPPTAAPPVVTWTIPKSAAPNSPFGGLPGRWSVGRTTAAFTDPSRPETLTKDRKDVRRLAVTVWYPVSSPDGAMASAFSADNTRFAAAIAPELKLKTVATLAALLGLTPRSWEDAPPATFDSPVPVVVISHDVARSPELYASTAETLATNGFFVVAVNHTFESIASASLTGLSVPSAAATAVLRARPDRYRAELLSLVERWTADTLFILDALRRTPAAPDHNAAQFTPDFANLLVIGHGVGGAVAAALASRDPFVRGGASLDGIIPSPSLVPSKPFLVFESLRSSRATAPPTSPTKQLLKQLRQNAAQYREYQSAFAESTEAKSLAPRAGGAHLVLLNDDHDAFADALLVRASRSLNEAARVREAVNTYVLEFARCVLLGADPALLREPSAHYPDVRIVAPMPATN